MTKLIHPAIVEIQEDGQMRVTIDFGDYGIASTAMPIDKGSAEYFSERFKCWNQLPSPNKEKE